MVISLICMLIKLMESSLLYSSLQLKGLSFSVNLGQFPY